MSNIINRNILKRDHKFYTVSGLDYKKFKLFQLFNLFMFAASKSSEFGCAMSIIEEDNKVKKTFINKDDYKKIIDYPKIKTEHSVTLIQTIFGGVKWIYFLTHQILLPEIKKLFISHSGNLCVGKSNVIESFRNTGSLYAIKIAEKQSKY